MVLELSRSPIGLLLSGGLDSSILLGHLLSLGCSVRPFYVRSGLIWQREELTAVRRFLDAVAQPALEPLLTLDLPVEDLYGDHWSITGHDPPGATTPDEAVYMPGRNVLLVVKAALWCHLHDIDRLALGVLGTSPFADATSEFFDGFQSVLDGAMGGRLEIIRPFDRLSKREVMDLGEALPLDLTFSCIAPRDGLHCGACNKCAERQAAFRLVEADDPTRYAVDAVVS